MISLYDHILAGQYDLPATFRDLSAAERSRMRDTIDSYLRSAVVIVADEVGEFYYTGNDKDEWDLETDFPALAAPFPSFWVETRRPSAIRTSAGVSSADHLVPQWGALFRATNPELGGAYWIYGTLFSDLGPMGRSGPFAEHAIKVDRQGNYLDMENYRISVSADVNYSAEERDIMLRGTAEAFAPLYLAISFMNCHNTTLSAVDPDPKLSRAFRRRTKEPLSRYYILDIRPMREILRTEGQSEKTGLKRALHICRGHFATYSEERPLFGKYAGTFWIPAHVRGTEDAGKVFKDYAIKAGGA